MRPNYEIPTNPVYNPDIPSLLDTDKASATLTFNPLFQRIINNIHAVKLQADTAKQQVGAIEQQVDTLKSTLLTLTGLKIKDVVNTFADLPDTCELAPGTLILVLEDETQNGTASVYEVDEYGHWVFVGAIDGLPGSEFAVGEHNQDPKAHEELFMGLQAQLDLLDGNDKAISENLSCFKQHVTAEVNTLSTHVTERTDAIDAIDTRTASIGTQAATISTQTTSIDTRTATISTQTTNLDARLTAARAALLDRLGSLPASGTNLSVNVRVQRGVAAVTLQSHMLLVAPVTIASVPLARSFVGSVHAGETAGTIQPAVRASLLSPTALTIYVIRPGAAAGSTSHHSLHWEVITFD